MANIGRAVDPKKTAPSGLFEPLAAGTYPVTIVASELRQNQNSEGTHVVLTMQVLDGPGRGRLLWLNVTRDNPSEEACRIGDETLSALCHAVGHTGKLKSTDPLHGQPFYVRVVIDQESGRNRVSRVLFDQKFEDAKLPPRPEVIDGNGQEAGQS